ncbi:MAG: F0F1 ATP synthase subunit delta [Nocardioides sp.]
MQGTRGTRWQGSSAASLSAVADDLDGALADGGDGARAGASLFVAADIMREQPALRRASTDPTVPGEAKAALARELFGRHLDETATRVVANAVARRWGAARDLPDALAHLAVVAVVKAADAAGEGDRLEEELFGFSRAVADHPELRDALSDPARTISDKQGLVRSLVEGKVTSFALELCERAVTATHQTVTSALEDFIELTSATRGRLVARVWSPRPLGERDADRLEAALTRIYDRQVHLNVVVDPDVLGGVRVEIGDEVIDGTIASRLDDARRRLVG